MDNKKVLLRISNLKQYFPLPQRGLYVKANDGITLDIYEGEVFGLVGESGCGKSTLGRTILQLYKQTDGRTMYYGRTIDSLAPKYVIRTIKTLDKQRKKLASLEAARDKMQAEYDALTTDKARFAMKDNLDQAIKAANDALLDMANIVGGFMIVDDLEPVKAIFTEEYNKSLELHNLELKRQKAQLKYDSAAYRVDNKGQEKYRPAMERAKAELDAIDASIEKVQKEIDEVRRRIDEMRTKYADNEEFQKLEELRDDGIDLARLDYNEMRQVRSDMQLIFQDPYSSLNPRMTVGQIVGEGMLAHEYFDKNDDRMQEEILRVMDECGLAPYFLHRYPHQFSGGQRQRIGIARALAVRPRFVVCDEAVSALDVSIQSQIINLLQDLRDKQNLTYMFITHDLSVVKYISDRIGVMYLGAMVELSDSQEMFDHPLHPYTEALLSAIPTTDEEAKELVILEGDIPSPVNPPKGCKFNTRCRYCTEICTKVTPEWIEVRPNHFVACHHILEKNL